MATLPVTLRLTQLRIKNFRSVGEVELNLGPLTVLVGPNGSGKSNVVDALRFMRDCFTVGLDQALLNRDGLATLRHWSAGGRPADVTLGITVADNTGQYQMDYGFTLTAKGNTVQIKQEEVQLRVPDEPVSRAVRSAKGLSSTYDGKRSGKELPLGGSFLNRLIGPQFMLLIATRPELRQEDADKQESQLRWNELTRKLENIIKKNLFYTLPASELRAPQKLLQENPLQEDGQNLSAVLQHLLRQKNRATALRQTMRRLVAGCVDITVETTGSYLVTYLHYQGVGGKIRKSDLGQESDGTLRVLAILAALYQDNTDVFSQEIVTPQFIALEEPESNIHPGMLGVLAELFLEASTRKQILLTTHSPDLLDFLPPESFRVVEKVDGETRVGPLADSQTEIVRAHLFTPGELLRTEGLHRQPTPAETDAAVVAPAE